MDSCEIATLIFTSFLACGICSYGIYERVIECYKKKDIGMKSPYNDLPISMEMER
tara:strand:- start:418 stop:582 length:165 start_codon:yes stop_codon:yes gene_type:complete